MPSTALLITAHPDDECMFFMPTIVNLQRDGINIHLLCLSTGNADGLGAVRSKELHAACKYLGLQEGCIRLVDDPALPDGMSERWPPETVAYHVSDAVEAYSPDMMITFDWYGVSGHANHIDVHKGVLEFMRQKMAMKKRKPLPELYTLTSTTLLRKYIGPFDLPLSLLEAWWSRDVRCHIGGGPLLGYGALARHASQFAWFRKLFIVFSRYVYVNSLQHVTLS